MTVDFCESGAVAESESHLLGRFAIERLHAQGGLGRVSLATDSRLKRSVAVKEIRPDRRTEDARRRFINEAEITGQLEHPGIVPIYSLESDANGEPYYVMRFIQGRPLSDAVNDFHRQPTQIGFRELLQRFKSVCQTIAYAHSRGVLHRDLKPANVMLGDFGETLVVDWGLAKRFNSRPALAASARTREIKSPESTVHEPNDGGATVARTPDGGADAASVSQTQAGQVLGTPAFMAPEQAAGQLDRIGIATDIYSLGAILYVILTGKPPVRGKNAGQIRQRAEVGDFLEPHKVQAGLPRALEAVCLKAMALDSSRRHANAQDLADDVEHWLADEPVLAYAEPFSARASRWLRKHRVLAGSATALLATALVAVTIGLILVNAERARTETARQNTAEALIRVTTEEENARTALANEMRANERRHAALETLTDGMLERLLSRQTQLGDDEKAYLRRVQSLYQEFADDRGESVTSREISAQGYRRVAAIHFHLNEFGEAERGYREAIAAYRKLQDDYPEATRFRVELSGCHHNLGFMLHEIGRFTESEMETRKAIAIREELIAIAPNVSDYKHLAAGGYINLGRTRRELKNPADEIAFYSRALELEQRAIGQQTTNVKYQEQLAAIESNLGLALREEGKIPPAIQHFRRSIEIRKAMPAKVRATPEIRSGLATTQLKLANLFREQGQRKDAEPLYVEGIAVLEKLAAEFPIVLDYRVELGGSYANFAGTIRENGQPEASLPLFQKSIDFLDPIQAKHRELDAARRYLRTTYWGRALALDQLNRRDEALRDWDRSLALCTEGERPQIQMPRAASLAGAGRHLEAIEEANKLVEGASAGIHYDAACVHALASVAVKDDPKLKEEYCVRAVELLHKAKELGLFRNRAMVAYIRTDNDLKPLHDRPAFQKLLVELEKGRPGK